MDTKYFEFDNITVEVAARTIDFWRGEYAKRRVFAENKDNYHDIEKAADTLQALAEKLWDHTGNDEEIADARDCEIVILNRVADGRIEEIVSSVVSRMPKGKKEIKALQAAYDLSIKYGYLITDLLLRDTPYSDKIAVLIAVSQLEPQFWQEALSNCSQLEGTVEVELENSPPRFYGPNSNPWHKTHSLADDKLKTVDGHYIESDCAFAIAGISDDDFSIRSTLGIIESIISFTRIQKLIQKEKELIKVLFRRAENTSVSSWHLISPELEGYLIDDYEFDKLINRFSSKERPSIRSIRDSYLKVNNEKVRLCKRFMSARNQALAGPYRGKMAEVSRAKGLYLWDTVHIEGKTDKEALQELKNELSNVKGLLAEDSPKDNKQINRLRITEACIRKNRFLPMT